MTRPTLEGCWAKLYRAEQHLNALYEETGVYIKGKPYKIADEPEQRGDWKVHKFTSVEPPPLQFGVQLGEIVHDLRSCLDHLVWQLVRWNGQTPDHRTAFPVCELEWPTKPQIPHDGRQVWNSTRTGNMTAGVHADHLAILKGLQPYNRGTRAHRDELAVLTDIWNTDKHRIIHAGLLKLSRAAKPIGIAGHVHGFPGIKGIFGVEPGTVKRGATAFAFRIIEAPFGIPPEVYVRASVGFAVRFGQRRLSFVFVEKLGRYIMEKVLGRFVPDFPQPRRPGPRPVFHQLAALSAKAKRAGGQTLRWQSADTPARFADWFVWFDLGPVVGAEPAWNLKSPEGRVFRLGVAGLQQAAFLETLARLGIPPDVVASIFEHFEPRVRDTDFGRMFCPSRGVP
jgi:hypothetical protein